MSFPIYSERECVMRKVLARIALVIITMWLLYFAYSVIADAIAFGKVHY